MTNCRWRLLGYDTFEGGDDAWYPLGTFDRESEALAAAYDRLRELEQTQPSATSGGQSAFGIQDQVWIEAPSGARRRIVTLSAPKTDHPTKT